MQRWLLASSLVALLVAVLTLSGGAQPAADSPSPPGARSLGAIGDGKADDTRALQQAIDAGQGAIVLPKGIYRIRQPLVIDLQRVGFTSLTSLGDAVLVMEGPGPALRLVGTHRSSADPENVRENVWQRQRMPLVDGIAIEGRHPAAIGIEAIGTMQLTLTRLHLRGLLHGVRLAENNRNFAISDCHIYDNHGVGIYYDQVDLHQSNIANCHISYNAGGGIVSRGGNVRNVHITGCDLESNMSPSAAPTANVLIDCRGSRYGTAEVAITGCTIQHNGASPDSANIRIIGRGDSPTGPPARWGHVTITGNVLSDVQVNVHLRDCRDVVLTGNTLWQGYQQNLLLEDCSHVVVSGNVLDRNPLYDNPNAPAGQDGQNRVELRNCEDCTLSGLHVAHVRGGPAGVLIEKSRRINLAHCTILDCDAAGLILREVQDSRVSDCLIRDDRPDSRAATILVERSTGVELHDNTLSRPTETK